MKNLEAVSRLLPLLVVLLLSSAVQAGVQIELDAGKTNQVRMETLGQGSYSITTKGGDPFVMTRKLKSGYNPDKEYVLSFDYFCAKGLNYIELLYGPPFRGGKSARGPAVLSSEGWTSYALNIKDKQKPDSWRAGYSLFRLDFGNQANRIIRIRNIQLRAPTARELTDQRQRERIERAKAEFEKKIQEMTAARHSIAIEEVTATADTIRIKFKSLPSIRDLLLCEVPLYQTAAGRTKFVWRGSTPLKAGQTSIEVPRFRKEGLAAHDRAYSSWVVMRRTASGLVPASHQRFVTQIPAKWRLKRDRPASKKGTTGLHGGNKLQFDDYKTLGIHNCTKNIVLHALIAQKAGGDTFPHSFNGRTYHIRRRAVNRLDRAMLEMDKLKIVVSAIILIAKNQSMTHPDCTPQGIWAMPNMVQRDGWNYYAAGLDFLAQRYSRPDRKYGRITHWIMHNEVDAGWVWTNAGAKPLHTYFDLYYRSMRTMQITARRYGVAGNVLISLTHHWTSAHNHLCYRPKDMIDLLGQRSGLEGDFDWGLAYHPYPQNLRDPRTWLDKKATFSFKTVFITPKNLEVLDAYMRQRHMLYAGRPRTIVLSEQGSNSRDHSEVSYRDQAAGLAWTWLKFEKLDTIESYVHHRWMDVKPGGEGGLLLGFWTNLPGESPRHRKKPAWNIYRQLGSREHSKAINYAKSVIPAEHFRNIPYTGPIER
jgi:hypothetical protein